MFSFSHQTPLHIKWTGLIVVFLYSFFFENRVEAQSQPHTASSVYYYRHALINCMMFDSLCVDSIFEKGKNNDSLITFEERIILSLYLQKYDDLHQWLSVSSAPKEVRTIDPQADIIGIFFGAGRKYKKLMKQIEERTLLHFGDDEFREFILLFLNYKKRFTCADHSAYNHRVLDFMSKYPRSAYREYVGNFLNREMEITDKVMGYDIVPITGAIREISGGDIGWKGWEPGFVSYRGYVGVRRNFYSSQIYNIQDLNKVPLYFDEEGPVEHNKFFRISFRYDRQLIETRRFEMFAFGDFGLGIATFFMAENANAKDRVIRFGTTGGGIRFQWNSWIRQDVRAVDTPYDAFTIPIGLEFTFMHNMINFNPVYRDLAAISLVVGLKIKQARYRKNSGLN